MIGLVAFCLWGCEPSYWVQHSDLLSVRSSPGSIAIPAVRDSDGKVVNLRSTAVIYTTPRAEGFGNSVLVKPQNGRLRAGWAVLAIGAVLSSGAIVAGILPEQPGCHDEACWLPKLSAGVTLGTAGGISLIVGAVLTGISLRDAEVR